MGCCGCLLLPCETVGLSMYWARPGRLGSPPPGIPKRSCSSTMCCPPLLAPQAVSATACAENGGSATASASGESQATATTVAEAASENYAAVFESLQSCTAPGAVPDATSPASLQCVVLPNTNLDGDVVQSTTAPTAEACCTSASAASVATSSPTAPCPPPAGEWRLGVRKSLLSGSTCTCPVSAVRCPAYQQL